MIWVFTVMWNVMLWRLCCNVISRACIGHVAFQAGTLPFCHRYLKYLLVLNDLVVQGIFWNYPGLGNFVAAN